MCTGKHSDKSKREVNQTDGVGGLGGRKTDRDRQRVKKKKALITRALFKCGVCVMCIWTLV